MKFDQDLRLNLRYDFDKMNSTLGSVVPLAMFLICEVPEMCKMHCAGGKERVRGLPHYAAAETGSLSPSSDLPAL